MAEQSGKRWSTDGCYRDRIDEDRLPINNPDPPLDSIRARFWRSPFSTSEICSWERPPRLDIHLHCKNMMNGTRSASRCAHCVRTISAEKKPTEAARWWTFFFASRMSLFPPPTTGRQSQRGQFGKRAAVECIGGTEWQRAAFSWKIVSAARKKLRRF